MCIRGCQKDSVSTFHEKFSPFNIYISQDFARGVQTFHQVLDKALVDIVERWIGDKDADFLSRMPLEKHEQDLLRWIDGPGCDLVPKFRERYGMWRTDYLVERNSEGKEQAKICEINSRIPFNGFWIVGRHETATGVLGGNSVGLVSPNDFAKTQEVILECFDHSKPLYHVREKWEGVDSRPLAQEYQHRTGKPMVTIKPSEIRLYRDQESATGFALFYENSSPRNGETKSETSLPQKIEQCSLELFQDEYRQLDPLILQHIARCCVNDLRNVFIVHDKRILGIILDELPTLEARNILTPAESRQLKAGVADTLLPGSQRLQNLLNLSKTDPNQRNLYIIKPIRDASGNGIRLAKHLSQQEWLDFLDTQTSRPLRPDEGACVVQRLADHVWLDIVRHYGESMQPERFHLTGSYHMINSRLGVFGPWRIGEEVLVSLDKQGGIIMSTVVKMGEGDGWNCAEHLYCN